MNLGPPINLKLPNAKETLEFISEKTIHKFESNNSCHFLPSANSSLPIAPRWENIPETLLLNGSIGCILFVTFLILTKIAWNRLDSPEQQLKQGLITFLYGYRDPERWYVIPRFEFLRYKDRHHKHQMDHSNLYVPPKLPLANTIEFSAYPSILTAEQLQASYISRRLNSFFSMFFRVTDADIIYSKGIDAYEYLLFQRHLILIMFITNLFCLSIILPVHWYSAHEDQLQATSFQRTTIKNVNPNSTLYWAHIFSSVSIVIITLYILNSYRESTIAKVNTQQARRTLLIGNIPTNQRSRLKLTSIIKNFFPRSSIEAIQFIYHTNLLERYQLQLDTILVAREYCQDVKDKYNMEVMVKPTGVNENQLCAGYCRICSFLYVASCFWPCEGAQPGRVFYANQEEIYRLKIKEACEQMVKQPSEYAFVTFKTYRHARRVVERLARFKVASRLNAGAPGTGRGVGAGPAAAVAAGPVPVSTSGANELADAAGQPAQTSDGSLASDPNSDTIVNNTTNQHIKSIRSPIEEAPANNQTKTSTSSPAPAPAGSEQKQNQQQVLGCSRSPLERSKIESLHEPDGPGKWSVRYAPHPDNIEFYDILNIARTSKYSIALYHLLMVIIFIFFTTPNVVLSILERLYVLQPDTAKALTGYQGLIINYFSILIQIVTTELLPTLISLISRQIPYENSASKNHSIMWKVYAFLVLMVIIMPSVGMNSAQALISSNINLKCLFPTDNGAYYINYVLSSIFLSTFLELIKPTDILFYAFILFTGRSCADFEAGRQYILKEFSVAMQHTSVMLIFSVVMTYTISCPLIAPAGLVYLIVKHSVDHYHLFYTYFTKKVDESLQNTILIFVKLSLLLMLLQTTLAISINTGVSYFSLISQIVFWISLAVFLFNCFFDFTSRAMISSKRNKYQREFCACFYTPRVIGDLMRCNAIPESCISKQV